MPERECIVCGRRGPFPSLFARGGFTLVRCPSCSLVFQDPIAARTDAGNTRVVPAGRVP